MNKDDIEKILKQANQHIKAIMHVHKVSDLAYENTRYVGEEFDVDGKLYGLSITDVMAFYKIKILLDSELITMEEYTKLENLYHQYLDISSEIGKEGLRQLFEEGYKSEKLESLHEALKEVKTVLKTFLIIDDEENYTDMYKTYFLSRVKSANREDNNK